MPGRFSAEKKNKPVAAGNRFQWLALVAVFVVGILIGVNAAVPGVSHAVDEITWNQILGPASAGAASLVQAINLASGSQVGQITGVDADSIDGLDSSQLGGGGSSSMFYTRECTWRGNAGGAVAANWPGSGTGMNDADTSFYKKRCETTGGADAGQPPACEAGDVSIGVDCFATGVGIVGPSATAMLPDGGGGFSFTYGGPNPYDITAYATVGVCKRLCKAGP